MNPSNQSLEEKLNFLIANAIGNEDLVQAILIARDHLSKISHDLRSPLNAMQTWVYVLEKKMIVDNNDPTVHRALEGIKKGIEQQIQCVHDLIDAPLSNMQKLSLKEKVVLREEEQD